MRIDMTPQVCSQCGLTWSGFHMCITALKDRIAALEARCRAAEKILHDAGEIRNRHWFSDDGCYK